VTIGPSGRDTFDRRSAGRSGNLLLVFASTVILSSGIRGNHTIFLFLPRLLRVLKGGLLFNEGRGLTTAGHAPLLGSYYSGHSQTHSTFEMIYSCK
jgi:hypothetical protein